MSQTYYLSSLTSDLSGGADFNRKLVTATETAGSIAIAVAVSATEDSYAFTEPGVPGPAGATGNFSTKVNVISVGSNLTLALAWARVDSSGVQQAISSFTTAQTLTVSVLTFSATGVNLGTWATGDRLKVVYRFTNSSPTNVRSVAIETGTTNTAVTTPFGLNYTLTLSSATFALTLQSVSFPISRRFSLEPMTFAITWPDVLLVQKTYSFTGNPQVTRSAQRTRVVYSRR